MAGSRVGSIYSLPKIVKRLEAKADQLNQQDNKVVNSNANKHNITNAQANAKASDLLHIAKEIEKKTKVCLTMPQLIEQLKQAGIGAYVKYT
ncbi:MAG: hypothetical protein ACK556_08120, partial [Pseudanabaena sp.]